MMPDLPNVDFERDVEQFIEFFENPAFRADGRYLSIVEICMYLEKWVECRRQVQ